jgi:hypothetical protein
VFEHYPITQGNQMASINDISPKWASRVIFLSVLLLFFTIPHTLEDFAAGEPAKAGIPAPAIASVISVMIALQAIGLFWLGQKRPWGLFVHIGIGLFWSIASGIAQLPTILSDTPYRSGFISVLYVAGMIVIGVAICIAAILSLKVDSKTSNRAGEHEKI